MTMQEWSAYYPNATFVYNAPYEADLIKFLSGDDKKVSDKHLDEFIVPGIEEVIFNEEAGVTVIRWVDSEKTIVRLGEGEKFDRYTGFMAAVCKRLFGSTARAKKLMNAADLKRQAQLIAEEEAKEKARKEAEMKAACEKAMKRRAADEAIEFDKLVQYYVTELRARQRAEEIVNGETQIPWE